MSTTLIANGRVIDPAQGLDRVTNLLLRDGRVAGYDVSPNGQDRILDATDRIVVPGLIDMNVHLCEPGHEEDETIATGTAAALAGGFATIACQPDTDPPIDTQAAVEFVQQQAHRAGQCHVLVVACVSKGREGKELAELAQLASAGAIAFSDNAAPIRDADLLRRAFEYCRMVDRPILDHPEATELSRGGVMHEGLVSLVLGLPGIPAEAEAVAIGRDVVLAEATGGRLHLTQVSTAGALEIIRRAHRREVPVTCAVTPHHFSLTDDALRTFDSNFKTSPPLRGRDDVEACIEGLRDGTIDVIASNHAPFASEKKMQELDLAPFGIVGLETTLALTITNLIEPKHLTWSQAIEKLSTAPARILGLKHKGTLAVGADADVTIIDPARRWTVEPKRFRSKSRNTPFGGWELTGRAETVLVGGQVRYALDSGRGG